METIAAHAPDPTGLIPAAGRVVAITGASRGLGAEIAKRLHADGYTLALGVRDPARTSASLGLGPDRVSYHRFDALQASTADSFIDAALAHHGRLDGLINNAGILRRFGFDHPDEAALDEMLSVNVKAPFRVMRRAMPALKASGCGRIVNIASTDAKRFRDPTAPLGYVMSKHALLALSHAARFEGYEAGVRVTALCPGAIDTDLIHGLPGATAAANRMKPATIAEIVALLLRLPNTASVAEMIVNTRLEHSL
jgi:NAD(P)-dependent dehydrogenase (short-subunit alcohol dehydrogenase family)